MSMHPRDLRIEDYTYNLPDERIAKFPLDERDASKLLVYDNGKISEDIYRNIANHIPIGSLMVFNNTKVIHARLLFKKTTGGVIEIFCLQPHTSYPDIQTAMMQHGHVLWECMVGGASKWKRDTTLQFFCEDGSFTLSASITAREAENYIIKLAWDNAELTFAEVLHHAGKVPLPPYIQREVIQEDEQRYQTIFAEDEGSVAAPTAALHFTPAILVALTEKQIDKTFVTLHVGAGTFKPVKTATIGEHDMHSEWIEVNVATIQQLLEHLDNDIVAIGTTSLRTIESLYWIGNKLVHGINPIFDGIAVTQWEPYCTTSICSVYDALKAILHYLEKQKIAKLLTRTQILIAEGYEFKIANMLVTNFHQPRSTLLLLIATFIGDDWKKVYNYALQHNFRFLSYGDGGIFRRVN